MCRQLCKTRCRKNKQFLKIAYFMRNIRREFLPYVALYKNKVFFSLKHRSKPTIKAQSMAKTRKIRRLIIRQKSEQIRPDFTVVYSNLKRLSPTSSLNSLSIFASITRTNISHVALITARLRCPPTVFPSLSDALMCK